MLSLFNAKQDAARLFCRASAMVAALSMVAGLAGCGHQAAKSGGATTDPLKVGVIPYDKADTVISQYTPFSKYIAKKAGRPDAVVNVTPEYIGVIQALRADQNDCAYIKKHNNVLE